VKDREREKENYTTIIKVFSEVSIRRWGFIIFKVVASLGGVSSGKRNVALSHRYFIPASF
jgi:hypothetical protein